MKKQFVNMLQDGDALNDYFVVARKDLLQSRDGNKYLRLLLKDKTGEITAVAWDRAQELASRFQLGDVVHIRGTVNAYRGEPQINLRDIFPLKQTEYALEDIVKSSEDVRADLRYLKEMLETVKDPHLRRLLDSFWEDNDFVARLTTAAAGKRWHHEYRGGLVRHCYEMCRIAEVMCELYTEINRDLLLTSIFLHDLGKLYEMNHGTVVDYTTPGKLLGHIYQGAELLWEKLRAIPNFPETLRTHLMHCLLAHHGELENGSPVVPKTLEAFVLHLIDNLDSQTAALARITRELRDEGKEWSDRIDLIGRAVWSGGNSDT